MAYDPVADNKQYVLTNMLDNIEGGASNTMKFLNEKMADDPDRWDDDVWRFMGQRIGGALIGGGVGSFGGPKGALGGAIVGGVIGFDNSAKLLGSIPGMSQLGRFQDATADGARYINEKLTPWLDPRVAGWGSRVVTDYLLERGVRSGTRAVTKGVRAYKAVSKADEIMSAAKQQDLGLQMKGVSERMSAATTLRNSEIRRLGKELLYDLQHPTASIPKLERNRTTPQIRYRQIFNNDPSHRYPSIEDLDLATRNTQFENPRINWKKERLKYTPTSATRWTAIGKRLQKEYGGSDEFVKGFIKRQRDTVATTQGEIKWLNEQMPIEYLQFALTDMVAPNRKTWDGAMMTRLTDDEIIDLTYDLFYRLATKKPKYFDYGHVKSAKNLAAETAAGTLTTADFASNIRPEIAHSIRDFYKLDPKGPNFNQILAGKKNPKSTDFKIIEPGNIARGRRQDMNDFVNMFMNYSPNVEHEYIKALGDWGVAMDNIIPFEWHDHFIEYLRKGIRKWQGSEKGGLLGAYQLRFYPREIRKLIDDYLNDLRDGNFPEELARKDFKVQEAIDEIEGIKGTADELARQRDVVRRKMPDSLKKDFKNPE